MGTPYFATKSLWHRSLASDKYNSFSGDTYFSRSFWGKSARGFCVFLGGFLLSLVPAFGRHPRRPKAGVRPEIIRE